ncbi:hypothetical protein Ocin01_12542 [Orchesella cincta]|uniref:Uncharacterized protein n=1 Tax=Orchesella cincta TaxID=48709 RepID=A0A1D2MMP3_ORCCI|nr:hypothetical protein Ocin01_12542 [Orchesella cincta]
MLFNLLFLGSLVFTVTISQNVTFPNAVTWVLGNSADPSQLDPAGEDVYGTLYVARARVDGEWVPGKGYYNGQIFFAAVDMMEEKLKLRTIRLFNVDPQVGFQYKKQGYLLEDGRPWLIVGKYVEDLFACRVAYDGEVPIYSFEILIESGKLTLMRGGTRWVPQDKNHRVPNDAVVGGVDPRTNDATYICRGFILEEGRPWLMIGKFFENYYVCRIPFNGEASAFSFEILVYYY